jgi:hypothetical protein
MKRAAACLLMALASTVPPAMAQAVGNPVDNPRSCSSLVQTEKASCLGKISRDTAAEPARQRTASGSEGTATLNGWIFSETTSPIDYSPVVVASATASGAPDGSGMTLSIACRGGNTSAALTVPSVLPAGERYAVSLAVDGGSPTILAAAPTPFGAGMALGLDVRLLFSLPAQGELSFRIIGRQGGGWEGRYSLADLKITRDRMVVSCKSSIKPDTMQRW